MSEEAAEYQAGPEIIPTEQHTLMFYDKPIIVVRLPDERPGVVVRSLCENMQIGTQAQIQRIQRTKPIAGDLVANVRIETEGGPQRTYVLTLRALSYWLATIDASRTREDIRDEVLRYQIHCVDALYAWAQGPRAIASPAVQTVIPADTISRPAQPVQSASLDEWRTYHLRMAAYIDALVEVQQWRETVDARMDEFESRLEGQEAVTGLIPEILERLAEASLTQPHRAAVHQTVDEICRLSGAPYQAVFFELNQAFRVAEYKAIPESQWPKVKQWLKRKLDAAKGAGK